MNQGAFTPVWPIGAVQVVTPGTLVGLLDAYAQFKASAAAQNAQGLVPGQTAYKCHKVTFVVDPANKGFTYVGRKAFNRTTRAGLIMLFPPGSAVSVFSWDLVSPGGRNDLVPEEYYVDADNANDQLIVTASMVGTR